MEPFTIATGTMHFAQNILIKIFTDEGIIGWGECSAFPMIVGETQNTCFVMAKDFAKIWKGKDPLAIESRLQELHQYTAGNYTIKSAFDMALYDIAAQYHQVPLYAFLGGTNHTIESDLTIGINTPEIMANNALAYAQRGIRCIKVKLGKKIEEDIERIEAIRNAIGTEITLRIDANQGWTPTDAKNILQALASFKIEFCEQPMAKFNDDLLPLLCATSPIPIMADESVFTWQDAARIIRTKSCHYINIKFAKSGGILEAKAIHQLAAEQGIPCMMGGMLESRLALTAMVHFAVANNNIKFFDLDTCIIGHLEDPVLNGVHYENGLQLTAPNLPGIGAQVDETYLSTLENISI
jgi:L-alanine-DL-glutamate epimerase-like enolase superfamily enzyme